MLTQSQKITINKKAAANIEKILKSFNIDNLLSLNDKLIGPCPVHDGDNEFAFNINIDKTCNYFGSWFCNSRKCHEDHNNDMIGFIRAMLEKRLDKDVSFHETINYINGFIEGYETNLDLTDNQDLITKIFHENKKEILICSREVVKMGLEIPCPYYLKRGFSAEVLKEFDVGFCSSPQKPMFNRTVFPVYDRTNTSMVGAVGRSIEENPAKKWINSKGFHSGNSLYGYGKAFSHIKKNRSIILVEGQGDVLRMYESDIMNCVGLFGCKMTEQQSILLEEASVDNIILALDGDEAGQRGIKSIVDKYSRIFNIIQITMPSNDIGDLTIKEVDEMIKPQIQGYC